MGSSIRKLEYDKQKKIWGPRCHKCNAIMILVYNGMFGDEYRCGDCGARFQEDILP